MWRSEAAVSFGFIAAVYRAAPAMAPMSGIPVSKVARTRSGAAA
jgi:hypothetical protein